MSFLHDVYLKIVRRALRWTFPLWERLGIHITPDHYYSPIPSLKDLKDELWEREAPLPGLSLNEGYQIAFLNDVCSKLKSEYDAFGLQKTEGDCPYYVYNGSFGEIDGDVLYCMVRHFQPQKVVEIGSGWSTLLTAHALKVNARQKGSRGELISIEPYPSPLLKRQDSGITALIERPVQEVDLAIFESLGENDILFIDSSHVSKIGSDVNYEILEILPRLKKGVLVHVHDIFIPYEYPRSWVKDLRIFWNELYLLQAFLTNNNTYEVLWAGYWMKQKHPELCARMFRSAASQSFWIRRTA